tara:strand:+ start:395 stop:739 length:345 start_codon:yes stop_codon:yes gene_type:complete
MPKGGISKKGTMGLARRENPNNYEQTLNHSLEQLLLRQFYEEKRARIIEGIIKYKEEEARREQDQKDDEAPKCATEGCECDAAFNEYYPNSEGGQYWTLCEKCYEEDQEDDEAK